METYTLITGGSNGIGKAMAQYSAKQGDNLLIIALDEPQLYETGKFLRASYPIQVHCFGVDLTHEGAPERIVEWCKENGYKVDKLINNAGFGRSGYFYKIDLQQQLSMMKLNNEVLVKLTYLFLPSMLELPKAYIMNMSSIEANMPNPYKAVYTGTKNFVYAFTLALREELKNTNIKVSVLCPGPTITNEDGLKRIQSQGKRAKVLIMMPDPVAKQAIDGMLEGRQVIVPGWTNSMINRIMYLLPTKLKMSILERIFRNYV